MSELSSLSSSFIYKPRMMTNMVEEQKQKQQRFRETIQRQREKLPIYASKDELVAHIEQNETVIILGETGSGKTTQIPQFVYERMMTMKKENKNNNTEFESNFPPRKEKGTMVAVTQPRRVAAVSVAKRVSQEIGDGGKLGDLVGYGIRFDDCSSEQTRIKFFTDGMLLREALNDPLLSRYGAIIVDEAHERTLQTDFLLGTLKAIQEKRRMNILEKDDDNDNNNNNNKRKKRKKRPPPPPLKLIIMSATLDASSFSDFFDACPIIYIKGRTFPVETYYLKEPEEDYIDAALCSVMQINEDEKDIKGDVLVFLTGQEEIESLGKLLTQRGKDTYPQLNVVLLFAAMPAEEQMKVFEETPKGTRKIVLATNIAETSLTIPGIRYVVDTGLTKMRTFKAKSGVEELKVVPIARSQATQRCGRAGREAPGKCYRLYTEDMMFSLAEQVVPELLRTNLAGVVLMLKAMGVNDVLTFPFIDKPSTEGLLRSLELLYSLGALDDKGELNKIGRQMSKFPLEPMACKCIIESRNQKCTEEIVAILAMLSTENVFVGRSIQVAKHKTGDHMTLLNLYADYSKVSRNGKKKWCNSHGVSFRAMNKAEKIKEQLSRSIGHIEDWDEDEEKDEEREGEEKEEKQEKENKSVRIRKALTAGFFMNAAKKESISDGSGGGSNSMFVTLIGGNRLFVHPSSTTFHKFSSRETAKEAVGISSSYIIFNELIRTNKLYARDVSVIEGEWLTEFGSRVFGTQR